MIINKNICFASALVVLAGCQYEEGSKDVAAQTRLQPIPENYLTSQELDPSKAIQLELVDTGLPDSGVGISNRTIDPNYPGTAGCLNVSWNTLYNINLPAGPGTYCIGLPTSSWETAKYEALVSGLTAGNDVDIELLQWDPATASYYSHGASITAGQADERVLTVSDDGHFVVLVAAAESNGGAFLFNAGLYLGIDEHELNDTPALAVPLTEWEYTSGNLDNIEDFDFFTYSVPYGQRKIDVYAQLQTWHTLLLDLGDGTGWQVLDDIPTSTDQYQKTYDVSGGNVVTLAVFQEPNNNTVNTQGTYRLRVNELNDVTSLRNFSALSYRNDTNTYFTQTIPGLYDSQTQQLMVGAHDQMKFFGLLWGGNSRPASNKQFTFSYSVSTEDAYGEIFYYTLTTDDSGWFSITLPLSGNSDYECRDRYNSYFNKPPQPYVGFKYDIYNFSITTPEVYNGGETEWMDRREYFWLCFSSGSNDFDYGIDY